MELHILYKQAIYSKINTFTISIESIPTFMRRYIFVIISVFVHNTFSIKNVGNVFSYDIIDVTKLNKTRG